MNISKELYLITESAIKCGSLLIEILNVHTSEKDCTYTIILKSREHDQGRVVVD